MSASWNKAWLELQKQYMDALCFGARPSPGGHSAGKTMPAWQQDLAGWWPGECFDTGRVSHAFFPHRKQEQWQWQNLGERFSEFLAAMSSSGDASADWQSVLSEQIELGKARMREGYHDFQSQAMLSGGQAMLDGWLELLNKVMSASSGGERSTAGARYNDAESAPQATAGANDVTLEGQRLWQRYVKSLQVYRAALLDIDLKSLDTLQEKILALANRGQSISSLRELYDLWVDCHDQACSRQMLSEEYSQAYGALVNALLALRAHSQKVCTASVAAMQPATSEQQATLQQELEKIRQQQELDKQRIRSLEKKIRKMANRPAAGRAKVGRKKAAKSAAQDGPGKTGLKARKDRR